MTEILILMTIASCSMGVARLLRIPYVPLLMLLGILLSPDDLRIDQEFLKDAMLFGLAFLVFAAGTSMNPARVGIQAKAAIRIGLIQMSVTAAIGYGLFQALGYTRTESFYIALAIGASSTLVVMRLLQQRRQLFEPFGRLVVGVLLFQDLVMILITTIIAHVDQGVSAVLRDLVIVSFLAIGTLAIARWITPRLLLSKHLDEEHQLLVALSILFLYLGVATLLEIHLIAGAFLAGVALSSFPASGILRGQLAPLVDFFTAIFFVCLGLFLELPNLDAILTAAALMLIIVLTTPILTATVGYFSGLSLRSSIEGGMLLALASEFSIILAMIGVQQGHIKQDILGLIVLVSVMTMMFIPFIGNDAVALTLTKAVARILPAGPKNVYNISNHVVLMGCGESGMKLLEILHNMHIPALVVDRDAAVIKQVQDLGFLGIRGDGGNPEHLQSMGLEHARLIVSTMTTLRENRAVAQAAGSTPVVVRVFEKQEARLVRSEKAVAIEISEVAAEEFGEWLRKYQLQKNQEQRELIE